MSAEPIEVVETTHPDDRAAVIVDRRKHVSRETARLIEEARQGGRRLERLPVDQPNKE